MSGALSEFAKEVAQSERIFIVRDKRGVPAPIAPGGRRSLPVWSSRARVERIIAKDMEFAGFEAEEMSWQEFRVEWLPRIEENRWLVGINWAGATAIGMDVEIEEVVSAVTNQLDQETARMVVETTRLWLREFTMNDLEPLTDIYEDAGTSQWLGDGTPRDTEATKRELERFLKLYQTRGFGPWAVVEKATGELMGHCGLQDLEGTDTIALTYALGFQWRGKGFATEAARAVINYAFEELKMTTIVAVAQISNVESVEVMKKLGMRLRGEETHYGKKVLVYDATRAH